MNPLCSATTASKMTSDMNVIQNIVHTPLKRTQSTCP